MNYDFMKKPPYDTHIPMFRSTAVNSPSSSPRASNFYPKLAHPVFPPPSSSSGMGIRVLVKPEYRLNPPGSGTDPVKTKYTASGLSKEAMPFAVAKHGDNPTKLRKFVDGYILLRGMGFSSSKVTEALTMYDNDYRKALASFFNNT